MEKIVVVNDTNVFIDLYNIGLLDAFFSLSWQVHTTDFVMLELLREGQQSKVAAYKDMGLLHIPVLEAREVAKIARMYKELKQKKNLSYTDCSVWYYAKVHNYVLLTGDRKLRTISSDDGVEVHGIIHVIDTLVEGGLLSLEDAITKLKLLYITNSRLPQDEKEKRIRLWKSEIEKKGGSL